MPTARFCKRWTVRGEPVRRLILSDAAGRDVLRSWG